MRIEPLKLPVQCVGTSVRRWPMCRIPSQAILQRVESNGAATGFMIDPVMIHSSAELDAAFSALDKEPPDALIVQPSLPIRRVAERRTFLHNHAPDIAAMDLFVVPTIGFKLLYGFVIVRVHRRELVWINVTTNPTAEWVARQITEAFP